MLRIECVTRIFYTFVQNIVFYIEIYKIQYFENYRKILIKCFLMNLIIFNIHYISFNILNNLKICIKKSTKSIEKRNKYVALQYKDIKDIFL